MKKLYIVALCLALMLCFAACANAGDIQSPVKPTEAKPDATETDPAKSPEEPSKPAADGPTSDPAEWESDIDFSDFETVPGQETEEDEESVENQPESTAPEQEPDAGEIPEESQPEETLSPTDEENFQRPMVKP